MAVKALPPELELAREATRKSAARAQQDLDEQRRKLAESENLRTVVRRLHARNHVRDDIAKLIRQAAGN